MIMLSPASTRPIRLSVPAKRGITVQKVDANLPAPAIRLLSGPPGTVPGPTGTPGADLNGYDPGDINLIFENNLI
jgi:hypothetical protein